LFTTVAIVSQKGPELNQIRNHLRNPARFTLREFHSLDQVNHGLTAYPFDVLLMRLNSFDVHHVTMIKKVQLRFPNIGLITVSPLIQPVARYEVKGVPRHKLLLEPMELEDLPNVVEKLARGDQSASRLHSRVMRKGECELVDADTGERTKAQFMDFAQMGARLHVQPRIPFKRNARIQLHYRSTSEPSRIHKIQSNIVWAEMASGMMGTIIHGPQQTVGLRFVAAL
jgi:hypothetical protein